jgi:phage terminase large subunit-like protein
LRRTPPITENHRKKKSIGRIDGIVALIMALLMALDRASTQPPPEKSVYETRGVLYV